MKNRLEQLIEVGDFERNSLELYDDNRVYLLKIRRRGDTIEVNHIYIAPKGEGGFKKIKDILLDSYKYGVRKVVMKKVVNARLAEHLAREGWELKADSQNYINFHKSLP